MEISNNLNSIQAYMGDVENSVSRLADGVDIAEGVSRIMTDEISLEVGIDAQIRSIDIQERVMGTLLDMMA